MLPEPSTLAVFMLATFLLNITPGPDMLYVIANSVGMGRRVGVVSALGITVGTLVHTCAAALGLSALLASSSLAYDAVRYAGAAYLLYLGVRTLLGRSSGGHLRAAEKVGLGRAFRRGITTNVLNPKVALFFLAFLPQFVDLHRGPAVWQFLSLGTLFIVSSTIVNASVALASGYLGERLGASPSVARTQRWFTGSVFLALGARIAVAGQR